MDLLEKSNKSKEKEGDKKDRPRTQEDTQEQTAEIMSRLFKRALDEGIPFRIEIGSQQTDPEPAEDDDEPIYQDIQDISIEEKIAAIVAEVTDPKKDTAAYGYRYATLDQVLQILRPLWKKYGLGVVQHPQLGADGKLHLDTIVLDGKHKIVFPSTWPIIEGTKMNAVQKIGATITYARRYMLSAIFGMAAEDDTDANETAAIPSHEHSNGNGNGGDASKLQALLDQIQTHIKNRNLDISAWLKEHKVKKIEDLNYTAAKELLKAIYTGQIPQKQGKEKGK